MIDSRVVLPRTGGAFQRDDLAGTHVEADAAQNLHPLSAFLESLADSAGFKDLFHGGYPRKTSAGSIRATRRKEKRAAARHMATVPTRTIPENCGVRRTVK